MTTSGNSGLLEEIRGSVTRLFVAILAALLLASMFAPPITRPAQAEVNDPGRAIEVFYERNLVLATGYPTDTKVRIDVIRAEQLVGSVTGRTDAGGNLEINHVGGNDCWGPNALDPNAPNVTPDIKPGDKVQTTVLNEDGTPKLDASGPGADAHPPAAARDKARRQGPDDGPERGGHPEARRGRRRRRRRLHRHARRRHRHGPD